MTSHAVRTESQEVLRGKSLIHLQVTISARGLIEWRGITIYMAILTGKRRAICLFLMRG